MFKLYLKKEQNKLLFMAGLTCIPVVYAQVTAAQTLRGSVGKQSAHATQLHYCATTVAEGSDTKLPATVLAVTWNW
jgi:hypothetical protein